ncbi:hypothetical protein ACFP47_10145 [Nesterenkonia lacusekhoensis]|uniref:Uncharacterized protein n=1 Tax=Nesterenkonia lacusekhoensis TaxID=150832 RepID=A0ABS4T512_9MICC|nr:hypothetical protein [Nesterenkonia lacusekhoensis]MBP2319561.1 hypothetical protein [Nesterenkonia lacusekhoensis]
MGYMYVQQHGAGVMVGVPDAAAAAMEALVKKRFAEGKGFIIDGLGDSSFQEPNLPVEAGETSTVLVHPNAHVVFTYKEPTLEDAQAQMNIIGQFLEESGTIRLSQEQV